MVMSARIINYPINGESDSHPDPPHHAGSSETGREPRPHHHGVAVKRNGRGNQNHGVDRGRCQEEHQRMAGRYSPAHQRLPYRHRCAFAGGNGHARKRRHRHTEHPAWEALIDGCWYERRQHTRHQYSQHKKRNGLHDQRNHDGCPRLNACVQWDKRGIDKRDAERAAEGNEHKGWNDPAACVNVDTFV